MRVERLRAEYEIELEYRHFPLHPDTPLEGLTLEDLFAGRDIDVPTAKARMTALMAREGLPYGDRTMTYNSRLAQELATWAATMANGANIHDALFRAYFVSNINLADIDNLIEVAAKAGLSPEGAREVLDERLVRAAVDADWQRSRDLGITGVPTFVLGDQMLVGAQPYERLELLLQQFGCARRAS